MSELITIPSSQAIPLPEPRVEIQIRRATMDDLPFIDGLQKKTSKMVGFMPTKQIEGKIAAGEVIVAEIHSPRRHGDTEGRTELDSDSFSVSPCLRGERIGYLIGCDRYFKRDDVGIIYAINVVPEYRRSLVAASLLKAQFEASAYGCKLYCCWCAQDIEANRFWESLGFVPLAFRAGSEKKSRVHIFWQKRIRSGDASTPWWFPSKTTGGSIREDRIVLPIPPDTHWSDAKPLILPSEIVERPKQLPQKRAKRETVEAPKARPIGNGLLYAIPQPGEALAEAKAKPAKEKVVRAKRKSDPRLTAAARELRDRWLEQVNAQDSPAPFAKYEVTRVMAESKGRASLPMIDAAAELPSIAA